MDLFMVQELVIMYVPGKYKAIYLYIGIHPKANSFCLITLRSWWYSSFNKWKEGGIFIRSFKGKTSWCYNLTE